jgi:hypothetical protein
LSANVRATTKEKGYDADAAGNFIPDRVFAEAKAPWRLGFTGCVFLFHLPCSRLVRVAPSFEDRPFAR